LALKPTQPPVDEAAGGRSGARLLQQTSYQRPHPRFRRVRQTVRGGIVVSLVAAIGAAMFILPAEENSILADAGSPLGSQAPTAPAATASQLASSPDAEVNGSLDVLSNTQSLTVARPQSRSSAPSDDGSTEGELAESIAVPTSADSTAATQNETSTSEGEGADGGGAGSSERPVADGAEPGPTTSTTVWVEPTLPPESEWVDAGNGVLVPDLLLRIRFCESTNNYLVANSYSTARGAYQFLTGSWEWYGHAERYGVAQAHLATPAEQDEAALRTLQQDGTRPWAASRACWSSPDIDPRYAYAKPAATTTTTEPTDDQSSTTETDESTTSTTETDESTTSTDSTDETATTEEPSADESTTTTAQEASSDAGSTSTEATSTGASTTEAASTGESVDG
jgi:hypothetical protein